jgi:hypothetical protein
MRPLQGDEKRPNDDGSHSTEITRTIQDDEGNWIVIPSLWNDNGKYVELGERESVFASRDYERSSGKRFPRFSSLEEAEKFAVERSRSGGVGVSPLAK